jgi:septum formation protein
MRLILASASPRRAELLRAAGYEFEIAPAHVDETIEPGEEPARHVRRLASAKSAAVSGSDLDSLHPGWRLGPDATKSAAVSGADLDFVHPGRPPGPDARNQDLTPIVIGADTVVVVDGRILGKPATDADAARMLRLLSARHHQVLTGVSVRLGARELGRVETTTVQFSPLTSDEIAWYVESGEGRDKAGAYAIQGLASRFIPRIDGSYSNVVGLPIACVRDLLTEISSTPPDRSSRCR